MKGVILQPGYIPWLGFFNQMLQADLFISLDDVQYDRRGWRNRNRILGPRDPIWLTVPVIQKGLYHQPLNLTRIDNSSDWASKHLTSLRHAYSKTPCFARYFPDLEQTLRQSFDLLVDLDYALIDLMRQWLGVSCPLRKSSDFSLHTDDKTGRLVELCMINGVTDYISGPLCRNYMDDSQLTENGITLWLHEYHHPQYNQRREPFVPFLSALDLLFYEGPQSGRIIRDDDALVRYDPSSVN